VKQGKDADEVEDILSVLSSLSSGSDTDEGHIRAVFENGVTIKATDDVVLMEQAEESLRSALELIKEASNNKGSWVDARDLLDETAAALDDAGLALRNRDAGSTGSHNTKKSFGISVGSKRGSRNEPKIPTESLIRSLADEVVNKRRRLLGDMLVHDADGVWAKSMYGDGDGISFGNAANDMSCSIPDKDKEMRALIVYASQTGTGKKFSKHLHKVLGGNSRCILKNIKNIALKDLALHKHVYIVCSTFGSGRPPREGEMFYSLAQLEAMRCEENIDDLCEGDEEKPLSGTSVAIAALGNSSFKDFARFGVGLGEELASLGASTALETTKIDAKNGKVAQATQFKTWENKIVKMERIRLEGWAPPTRKPSLVKKVVKD